MHTFVKLDILFTVCYLNFHKCRPYKWLARLEKIHCLYGSMQGIDTGARQQCTCVSQCIRVLLRASHGHVRAIVYCTQQLATSHCGQKSIDINNVKKEEVTNIMLFKTLEYWSLLLSISSTKRVILHS